MNKADITITTANGIQYGFGPTNDPSSVYRWYSNTTFQVPNGNWFFFTKKADGTYDVVQMNVECEEEETCSFVMEVVPTNPTVCNTLIFNTASFVKNCGSTTAFTVFVSQNQNQNCEFKIGNGSWQNANVGKNGFSFSTASDGSSITISARIVGCTNATTTTVVACTAAAACSFVMQVVPTVTQTVHSAYITTGYTT